MANRSLLTDIGLGLLQSGAPSLRPTSPLGALGRGAAQGLSQNRARQREALQSRLLEGQVGQMEAAQKAAARRQAAIQQMQRSVTQAGQPVPVPPGQQGPPGPAPGMQGLLQSPQFMGNLLQAYPKAAMGVLTREPQAGFTLSPGQRRFGPGGAEIAGAPEAAKPPPVGWRQTPTGLAPITGGPADPDYLKRRAAATAPPGAITPYTNIGKARLDFRRGLITDDDLAHQIRAQKGSAFSKEAFKRADTLRDEFVKLTGSFRTVRDSYNRIKESAFSPDAQGDLALIFNYMKVLDPGSVVRESEFATAAAAGSYGDRVEGAAQRILSGKRLSVRQRKGFVDRAKRLYGAQLRTYEGTRKEYRRLSETFGIDPSGVIVEQAPPAPPPGKPEPTKRPTPARAGPFKIRKMSVDDLTKLDMEALSPAELKAAIARHDELEKGAR